MHTRSTRNVFLILELAVLFVLLLRIPRDAQATPSASAARRQRVAAGMVEASTPTSATEASPSSTPSPEAQKALAYIAQREGIAIDNLVVVNAFRRSAALLTRTFQAVTVLETPGGRVFQLLVDLDSGQVEERATVEDAEARASNAKYGKFQPALYERLQQLQDTDLVTVTLVVAAGPGQSLGEREIAARAALAAKYPEARAAIDRHGKPMDVADPALAAQIYKRFIPVRISSYRSRTGMSRWVRR